MTVVISTPLGNGMPDTADRTRDTTPAGISWVHFATHRAAVRRQWPQLHRLRVVTDLFEPLRRTRAPIRSVLDVGATSHVWEPTVLRYWVAAEYRSLDIDRSLPQDYYDFADVDRDFDLVTCFEVLEHLPAPEVIRMAEACFRAARPGGFVLFSVPNVCLPIVQSEFTHVTNIGYADLGAIMRWAGLEVMDISRLHFGRGWERTLHRTLLAPVHRLFRTCFCRSIVALGRRPLA